MYQRIHYSRCPICASSDLQEAISAIDHTVSNERFSILQCGQCGLRITQDVPDAASIAPYYKSENYISHTDTAKGLINKLYRFVRQRTLLGKKRLIEKETGTGNKKGNLLDVGSGTGSFAATMQQAGWKVCGLEPDTDARKMAKDVHGLELEDSDVLYSLPPQSFDAITLWHVLEHVHDLQAYIRQLKNLLAPAGKLFIAVPNYTARDAQVYGEHWAAYDVPRHLYHFSPAAMKTLVEKQGLAISSYEPMWYDSYYITLLSSRYKNGKTHWIGAAWQGLRSNLSARRDTRLCSSVIYVITHQQ